MSNLPLPEWLLRWLCGDRFESIKDGEASLRLARFPEGDFGLLALLLVAVGLAIIYFTYSREGALARWKKYSLASIRALLVLFIALIAFYPVIEVNRKREVRKVTILLLDDSLSLTLKDGYRGAPEKLRLLAAGLGLEISKVTDTSRADLVNHLIQDPDKKLLELLREKNRLEIYTFSNSLKRPPAAANPPPASPGEETAAPTTSITLKPDGTATNLAGALRKAVEQQAGSKIAAVVVLSDGRLTAGEDVPSVAAFLRKQKIPVHTVGVGDPTPARNIRIDSVLASERVFAGDPMTVDVQVSQSKYEEESIEVQLFGSLLQNGTTPGPEQLLKSATLRFEAGKDSTTARFAVDLKEKGRHRLSARVAVRPEETFTDDNESTTVTEVVEEASRVLLISGAPSYEYRFLLNLLRRDRRVSVSAWLMSADPDFPQGGNISLEKLPGTAKEMFEYDVAILLDPDPRDFPTTLTGLLRRFVAEQNGGLVYVAGEKYSSAFFRSAPMKPVHEMIPVFADLSGAGEVPGTTGFSTREWPLRPTRAASTHDSTRLASNPLRNNQRWEELPGIYWSFRVRKAKPGATVLFRYSDPSRRVAGKDQPLLAWQYFAGGRTIFLGSDETWRWRVSTDEIYDQFWMQTIRHLTEARLAGGRRSVLQSDRKAYDFGDTVRISALLQDENFQPLEDEIQALSVEGPEGETQELRLEKDSSAPGWYRGIFIPRHLGTYKLRLANGTTANLQVEPPEIEFRQPELDEQSLGQLASITGGSYNPIWATGSIPGQIDQKPEIIQSKDEPITLWDNWLSLCILAGLLTLEWVFRKLAQLL
jgi:hypothetical protein